MELTAEINTQIKKKDALLKFLWFGNLFSLAIYVFIAYKAVAEKKMPEGRDVNYLFIIVVSVISLVCFIVSFIYRHYLLSPKALRGIFKGRIPWFFKIRFQNNYTEAQSHADLSDEKGRLKWYISNFLNFQLFHWGIGNSCAVMGLMASVINGIPELIFPFISGSLTVICWQFPSLNSLIESALKNEDMDQYKEI